MAPTFAGHQSIRSSAKMQDEPAVTALPVRLDAVRTDSCTVTRCQ
jgi:hypothetical protein